jgi:hypothetical protein
VKCVSTNPYFSDLRQIPSLSKSLERTADLLADTFVANVIIFTIFMHPCMGAFPPSNKWGANRNGNAYISDALWREMEEEDGAATDFYESAAL